MKFSILSSFLLNKIKSLAFVGALTILALGSTNSFASMAVSSMLNNGLPGIVPPSLPAFATSVNVNYLKGSSSSQLTATYNKDIGFSILAYPNKIFSVKDTKYTLNAQFNNSGVFQTGTVKIQGKIPGLGITNYETLMTADLTAFAMSSSGYIYGFNTNNIVCNSNISAYAGCTTAESIYLGLFNPEKSLKKSWSTKGIALTSIPIPTAVWLFGSGMMGLFGFVRHKKIKNYLIKI